jgi:general L-amino acid transport system substrate-binding protein
VKSPTLDAVKKRGELFCGVDTGIPGFAYQDLGGQVEGFRHRLPPRHCAQCWAIRKVKYVGVTAKVQPRSCSRVKSTC